MPSISLAFFMKQRLVASDNVPVAQRVSEMFHSALGGRGRGPVGRMFLGSVTENVIRGAGYPVLTVRK